MRMNTAAVVALPLCICAATAFGQGASAPASVPPAAPDFIDDWRYEESQHIGNPVQLTFGDRFVKAGEAYFSPDGRQVVFQAVEKPAEGASPDDFYAMFVADLGPGAAGQPALSNIRRVSPPGSANTCGWFDAGHPGRLIFGSTIEPPREDEQAPGYQRGTGRYRWAFPAQMRVVEVELAEADGTAAPLRTVVGDGKGYTAECSTSPDGRWLLYAALRGADCDIFVLDRRSGMSIPLVTARGYDGGPFFSPDATRICFRSDRVGDDLLQLRIADLKRDESGAITGVENERALTANSCVNWCPFWHPTSGKLVYATSQMGHQNYEVFEIAAAPGTDPAAPLPVPTRVTFAPGADVLPAFDPTGKRLMWTSKRGPDGTSQLWIGDWQPGVSSQ